MEPLRLAQAGVRAHMSLGLLVTPCKACQAPSPAPHTTLGLYQDSLKVQFAMCQPRPDLTICTPQSSGGLPVGHGKRNRLLINALFLMGDAGQEVVVPSFFTKIKSLPIHVEPDF